VPHVKRKAAYRNSGGMGSSMCDRVKGHLTSPFGKHRPQLSSLCLIFAIMFFQQHGPVRFPVRSGLFFPQERIINNFSASLSGSLPVRFWLFM
jgi:hypothetical protein